MDKSHKKRSKSFYFWLACLSLVLFVAFTLVVKRHLIDKFDFNTTVKIQDHVSKQFDTFFSIFSLIGSYEILAAVLLIFIWLQKKIKGIVVFAIFLLTHFVELIGKTFLHHPGPPFLFFRYDLPIYFPSSYVQPGSSYPSGHSFRSIFIATLFIYAIFKSKRLSFTQKTLCSWAVVFIAGLTLFSRVSLGEHWTSDVIGGFLLGLAAGFLALLFV